MIYGSARRLLPQAGGRLFFPNMVARVRMRGYSSGRPNPASPESPKLARRIFTWGTIGANAAVYLAWNASKSPDTQPDEASRRSRRRLGQLMEDNFTLSQRNLREGRYWTLITGAFSHQEWDHLFFNMFTFALLSRLGFSSGLGTTRMLTLAIGATLTSSACAMLNERTRGGPELAQKHLGASGMVTGLLMAMALMRPGVPVQIMFVPIDIPLWVAVGGFVAWDGYCLVRERESGPQPGWTGKYVSYAMHLGGGAFGAGYYLLRLRHRFGRGAAP